LDAGKEAAEVAVALNRPANLFMRNCNVFTENERDCLTCRDLAKAGLLRPKGVESVGDKNADAQNDQNSCYSRKHREFLMNHRIKKSCACTVKMNHIAAVSSVAR
jgi:hypothetical protein